jgi:hypothetical protein
MAPKRKTTYTDPLGQTIPAKYVGNYDKARDAAAEEIAARWLKMEGVLQDLHTWTVEKVVGVVAASATALAAEPGAKAIGQGARGNAQFRSFDGNVVVSLDAQAREEFEPQLIAEAQRLVQEVIAEGTAAIRASGAGGLAVDVGQIAERAFTPRKSGRLDMARVRELTTLRVAHPKWEHAMEIISRASRLVGVRRYLRVEVRPGPSSQFRPVQLDMASAGTAAEEAAIVAAAAREDARPPEPSQTEGGAE